jgi:hypothetical protein
MSTKEDPYGKSTLDEIKKMIKISFPDIEIINEGYQSKNDPDVIFTRLKISRRKITEKMIERMKKIVSEYDDYVLSEEKNDDIAFDNWYIESKEESLND